MKRLLVDIKANGREELNLLVRATVKKKVLGGEENTVKFGCSQI